MKSRSRTLLDKSIGAMLAAIEVYNKPNFAYREETFSILAVTAWELLLKARILQIDGNRLDAIIEYERRPTTQGSPSKKLYKKTNRSGNHVTISLFKAYDRLVNDYGDPIDPVIRKNLEALAGIRDNSIHFVNHSLQLVKTVQEIGTAALRNYMNVVRQWFATDLSQYNFYLMPLAFVRDFQHGEALVLNPNEKKFIEYVHSLQTAVPNDDEDREFNLLLAIDLKFKKSSSTTAAEVRVTSDPAAPAVQLKEEDFRDKYPWTYEILTRRLGTRYVDFKANQKYHSVRKPLEKDSRFCTTRLLDPGNPKSPKKRFYNPNIVSEFDAHYSLKRNTA